MKSSPLPLTEVGPVDAIDKVTGPTGYVFSNQSKLTTKLRQKAIIHSDLWMKPMGENDLLVAIPVLGDNSTKSDLVLFSINQIDGMLRYKIEYASYVFLPDGYREQFKSSLAVNLLSNQLLGKKNIVISNVSVRVAYMVRKNEPIRFVLNKEPSEVRAEPLCEDNLDTVTVTIIITCKSKDDDETFSFGYELPLPTTFIPHEHFIDIPTLSTKLL